MPNGKLKPNPIKIKTNQKPRLNADNPITRRNVKIGSPFRINLPIRKSAVSEAKKIASPKSKESIKFFEGITLIEEKPMSVDSRAVAAKDVLVDGRKNMEP